MFVLYADMHGVPCPWLFKTLASDVGLEELLVNSAVIDSQVPPQVHINDCRYVTTRPSSYANNYDSYSVTILLSMSTTVLHWQGHPSQRADLY